MPEGKPVPKRLALVALSLAVWSLALPAQAADTYRQPVWFLWERSTLDVVIVPPAHGQLWNSGGVLGGQGVMEATPFNSYLAAIERAASDWRRAVDTFGPSWLRSGLVMRTYVVGRDNVPGSALLQPEIVVVTDETKGPLLGASISTRPCVADSSSFYTASFTPTDMYNVSLHEIGHCLGLDHATGPSSGKITHDTMYASYGHTPGAAGTHSHCPSNLNVAGLERVFGPLFEKPGGGSVSMSSTDYKRITC
ncbi:MAG: hypothetical protein ACRDI0_12970 [Actinomycetota bacterium]